ncbi:phage tail tape measure protein [Gordonia malaquae]|uniref:phage tail tape measure protein n=1 Tax=Gordonia malaquae TaxID=410332 RepID=UPI003019C18A
MAGGRIDIDVVLNDRDLARRLDGTLTRATSMASKAAGVLGVAFGGAAIVAGLKSVAAAGMDYDQVMNQIRGTSGATDAEMRKLSETARQLGNDASIPATSARDAATAMLELGKGGLTVQQAMEAARGSLTLAAAAQIDAGQAAEIQGQALNTFSLDASKAGHVADVLANTANRAAGEITDIAEGLQQSGSVAAQFGMTIEQTAGALGVLANNGITGSDAGTLLKSTLLALQDTAEPASAAMETLGIKVYDAQGKFRGLGPIMDELKAASSRLTEEQFNQATNVLFGSDAMRLAGIAAKDGSASFREMADAVGKAGGAAKLGEEMSKGLPGAVAALSNAADEAKLALYDLLRGPLTDLAEYGADKLSGIAELIKGGGIPRAVDGLRPIIENVKELGAAGTEAAQKFAGPGGGLDMAADAAKATGQVAVAGLAPVVGVVQGAASAFAALPAPVQTAALAMASMGFARSKLNSHIQAGAGLERGQMTRLQRMGREIGSFNGAMRTQTALAGMSGQQLSRSASIMAAYQTSTGHAVSAMRGFTNQVGQIRAGAAAAGTPISALSATMRTMGERSAALQRIGTAFTTASAGASTFARTAGTVAASGTALKMAGSSIVGAFGGPVGFGITATIMAATWALSAHKKRQQEAAQAAAEHAAAVKNLVGQINLETGALTAAGKEQLTKDLSGGAGLGDDNDTFKYARDLGISSRLVVDAASGQRTAIRSLNSDLDDLIETSLASSSVWKDNAHLLREQGISAGTLGRALRGDKDAIGAVTPGLDNLNLSLDDMRGQLSGAGSAAAHLGVNTAAASDRVEEATGIQRGQAEALAATNPQAKALAEQMDVLASNTSTAADKAGALKKALDILTGDADTFDEAMGAAAESNRKVADAWNAAAGEAGSYNKVVGDDGRISTKTEATAELASTVRDVRDSMHTAAASALEMAQNQGKSSEEAATAATTAAREIYDSFMHQSEGAKRAGVDVAEVAAAMGLLPPETTIDLLLAGDGEVTAELALVRAKLEMVPKNTPVKITALSDDAREKLEMIKGLVIERIPGSKDVKVTATTDQAAARINDLVDGLAKINSKQVTVTVTQQIHQMVTQGPGTAPQPVEGVPFLNTPGRRFATGGGVADDGAIRGPGSGTSDSIRTSVREGSHIFTAAEVRAAGGHGAINRKMAAMSTSSVASAGAGPMVPVALSNGEHYASPEQVDALGGHDAMLAFRAGLTGDGGTAAAQQRQGLYLGGLVRAEQVGKQNDGLPYITGARDCSMWVSWMVSAAQGKELQRLFTTYSLIGGQTAGLVSGASPSDALTVGTSMEHMAATVRTEQGPVNTESGGNSSPSQVRWGRGAAGAFDPQFTHRFHLPENLINPPITTEPAPDDKSSTTTTDSTSSDSTPQRQYIEAPKAPKAEDVAAEAARIGVRGLLETFGLEDSVIADPDKFVAGRAWQIGENTKRFRNEQGEAPTTSGVSEADQNAYDIAKLKRDQKYENDRLAIKNSMPPGAARDRKLLDLKQDHDKAGLDAKIALRGKKNGTTSTTDPSAPSTPTGPTTGSADSDPYLAVNSAPYRPGAGAAQWSKEIAAALKITNSAASLASAMIGQGDIESKGDPRAVGPDSSDGKPMGWMQVKPPTFAANRDPKLPNDPFNVLANGVASLNYANKRYPQGIPWPTTQGYWGGGISPMDSKSAAIVGPGKFRLLGDRQLTDEFFIPDTDDPQHIEIGAEWARRRGFQLVNMHADGGTAARARGGQAALMDRPAAVGGPVTKNYNYSGPAEQAPKYFREARRHDRIDTAGAGVRRAGAKGVRW